MSEEYRDDIREIKESLKELFKLVHTIKDKQANDLLEMATRLVKVETYIKVIWTALGVSILSLVGVIAEFLMMLSGN